MSMNSTAAVSGQVPSLPPGLVPLPLVQEELKWLLLETIYTSFLVPIAVVLFFFSTPRLRRRPIFFLNVCALALGIAQGIIGISNYDITRAQVNALLLNLSATPSAAIASVYLFTIVPLCVQGILILRVTAAYPPRTMRRPLLFAVYGPIVLFKLGRIANVIYMIFRLQQIVDDAGGLSSNSVFTVSQAVWTLPSAKVEWFLQLFDDMYVSTLFILRLRQRTGMLAGQPNIERLHTSSSGQGTYFERIKTLFWIAVFNFVFPVIFNVVLIVLAFVDHDFLEGSYILYTNNYVEIIGVLLATIWAAGKHDSNSGHGDSSSSASARIGTYGQGIESLCTTQVVLPSVMVESRGYLQPWETMKSVEST